MALVNVVKGINLSFFFRSARNYPGEDRRAQRHACFRPRREAAPRSQAGHGLCVVCVSVCVRAREGVGACVRVCVCVKDIGVTALIMTKPPHPALAARPRHSHPSPRGGGGGAACGYVDQMGPSA